MTHQAANLKAILSSSRTQHRLFLADALRRDKLSTEELQELWAQLAEDPEVSLEIENIKQAVTSGTAFSPPDLSTPGLQLAWAAGLCYIRANPPVVMLWPKALQAQRLEDTPLWRQLTSSEDARFELAKNAWHVASRIRNTSTRLGWGGPGSWFFFDPDKNRINADLLFSLVAGFEHTRSVLLHEIGHSELSVAFPPSMQRLYDEMLPLAKRAQRDKKLSRDDYKRLAMLKAEWKLRHSLWNNAEDNCVNRFAVNVGKRLAQDYGPSLNHISASITGVGMIAMKPRPSAEAAPKAGEAEQPQVPDAVKQAEKALRDLGHAINMSFFKNNKLFPDNAEGWESVGLDPRTIKAEPAPALDGDAPVVAGEEPFPGKDFAELMEMCGGFVGLEHLQPGPRDRLRGAEAYARLVERRCRDRNEIIEYIWDHYAERYARILLEEQEKKVEEKLDQAQNGKGDASDDAAEQKGQGGQGGKSGSRRRGQQGGGGDAGEDEDGEGEETIEVEGSGQQKEIKLPPKDPNDRNNGKSAEETAEENADAEAGDQKGGKGKNRDDKTLEELLGEDGEDGDEDGGEPSSQRNSRRGRKAEAGNGAGSGDGRPLDDLASGSWENYQARVAELAAPIALAARLLRKLRDYQVENRRRLSRRLETLPPDGDFDRFSMKAHQDLVTKQVTNQRLEADDRKRFRVDETTQEPSAINVVLLIDGSGSMSCHDGNAVTRLERALQSSCILYEAARTLGGSVNVFIGMWGDSNPPILARPGDDAVTIGRAMETARKGLASGTSLAPAIRKTVRVLTDWLSRTKRPVMGCTHIVVLSDGDVDDTTASKIELERLLGGSRHVTVDFAVIVKNRVSVDDMAPRIQTRRAMQEVGVLHDVDARQLPLSVVALVLRRIRENGSFIAPPTQKIRSAFRRIVKQMEPN